MGEKPIGISEIDCNMLNKNILGMVRLSLLRNIIFNIVKELTTTSLIEALTNMYENFSVIN